MRSRGAPASRDRQSDGHFAGIPWNRKGQKTMEIAGFGRIGKAVAGAALAVSLVMPLVASAQDATVTPYTPGADLGSLSGTISVDGSSTVGPIMEALAEEFAGQASGVKVPVDISGTGGGF